MTSKSETQKPDSRVFGMCSFVDWGQLISKWAAVKGSCVNYYNPQTLIFQMKLIHITGVLQTASHDGIHGMFKMFSVKL